MQPVLFYDRQSKSVQTEVIYGETLMRYLYETGPGAKLVDWFFSKHFVSRLYGHYQDSGLSRSKIKAFVRDFEIQMQEYEETRYSSFNDFFIRKFRPGARVFAGAGAMPAFAEARYLAFDQIRAEQSFPVKGAYLTAEALLGGAEKARPFQDGPLLLARLCPTDYHRFHYPDEGTVEDHYRIGGALHSVNPLALAARGDILATNERQVTILNTQRFGKLAYIEVGALCVGKIVQTHLTSGKPSSTFRRGEEKGYFLFGASTVIVIGEAGRWRPDLDLLEQTQQKRETLVRLGEQVAQAVATA